jgi:hypothetical protein
MRTGRPIPAVILSPDERVTLAQWARRPKTAQALAQRARIVLASVNATVPAALDVHVIVDNASTHKTPLIHRWLARHPRVQSISRRPAARGSTSSSAGSPP